MNEQLTPTEVVILRQLKQQQGAAITGELLQSLNEAMKRSYTIYNLYKRLERLRLLNLITFSGVKMVSTPKLTTKLLWSESRRQARQDGKSIKKWSKGLTSKPFH